MQQAIKPLARLLDDPSAINGKICTVQYMKVLDWKKDYLDRTGDLMKITKASGIKIGTGHQTTMGNQQEREGDPRDYQPVGPPAGKTWLYYPILLTDVKTGQKKYIKFEQWSDLIQWSRHWELKGKVIENIDQYKPMLLASSWKSYSQHNGPTEREYQYLTLDMTNILSVEVNGVCYQQ